MFSIHFLGLETKVIEPKILNFFEYWALFIIIFLQVDK